MSEERQLDYPWDDVVNNAVDMILRGFTIYQKFTCVGCGARQTMDVPNTMYEMGTCEACGATTNIRKRGCNFLLIGGLR
jgi:hypothetical protein